MSRPAVRLRIDFGQTAAVGPGKIALLEHIAASGSLAQAARELGMSYRRAWQLLGSLNGSFRQPLVDSARGGRGGGGARLTERGRQLIRAYRGLEAEMQVRAARHFRALAGCARAVAGGPRPRPALLPRRQGAKSRAAAR
ncbi:MAG TPA: LysR family transcriptional regulator [Steroidobacteraceae bacterium]|nr:LysR family transcriptional regulator [Steroidobacteraceae bacterium]